MLAIIILFLSGTSFATDLFWSTQHIAIKRQNKIGRQHEIAVKQDLTRKIYAGLSGTYLERFNFFEKRYGAFVGYKINDRLNVEARWYRGENDNQILPRDQKILSAYYAAAPGLTPYIVYHDYRYSVTRVNMANLGMEIEKLANIILIPQVMMGKATFSTPAGTESIYHYGLRAMYYVEKKFSAFIFGFKGREASQGIVGKSNILVETLSGGLGGSYFVREDLRTELVFDHTNYKQLKNQFLTTTLNLYWTF